MASIGGCCRESHDCDFCVVNDSIVVVIDFCVMVASFDCEKGKKAQAGKRNCVVFALTDVRRCQHTGVLYERTLEVMNMDPRKMEWAAKQQQQQWIVQRGCRNQ
mmetsp:Transcript_6813/g.13841  ORF Transcript_6813/g.13841 Transcript_6813/m.13841 type:complete len:104 (-) Transcript_6813:161-472(-)